MRQCIVQQLLNTVLQMAVVCVVVDILMSVMSANQVSFIQYTCITLKQLILHFWNKEIEMAFVICGN